MVFLVALAARRTAGKVCSALSPSLTQFLPVFYIPYCRYWCTCSFLSFFSNEFCLHAPTSACTWANPRESASQLPGLRWVSALGRSLEPSPTQRCPEGGGLTSPEETLHQGRMRIGMKVPQPPVGPGGRFKVSAPQFSGDSGMHVPTAITSFICFCDSPSTGVSFS